MKPNSTQQSASKDEFRGLK